MKNFNRAGRRLPTHQVSHSLDSNPLITPNTPLMMGLTTLTSDEKNSYASYLASLIYDYQLKLKYASICLLTFLTLLSFDFAYAQKITKSEIVPLQIGDTIPEALWDMPLQVLNHPEGKDTIRLADYRDKKLIILDFWATWCAPCIKGLYSLDTIQKKITDDLMILPMTTENKDMVSKFFDNTDWQLLSVINRSKDLKKYFPHLAIPYQVWIQDDILLATTDGNQSTYNNIKGVINKNGKSSLLIRKDNLEYNSQKPLLFDNNGGDVNDLMSSSVITGYLNGIVGRGGIHMNSAGKKRFRVINANIAQLYQAVASRYNRELLKRNRLIIDRTILKQIPEGRPNSNPDIQPYFYCYEAIMPDINDSIMVNHLFDDLNKFFMYARGVKGQLVDYDTLCWVLSLNKEKIGTVDNSLSRVPETIFYEDHVEYINQPTVVIFSSLQALFPNIEIPIVNEMDASSLSLKIPYNSKDINFTSIVNSMINQGINVSQQVRTIQMVKIDKHIP